MPTIHVTVNIIILVNTISTKPAKLSLFVEEQNLSCADVLLTSASQPEQLALHSPLDTKKLLASAEVRGSHNI